MEKEKKRLFYLLKKYAFKRGKFILSSGKESSYYIDARAVTLTSEGAYLCAEIILDLIKPCTFEEASSCIGGPSLGADPILGAIAALAYLKGLNLKTFIIRKEEKSYGRRREVEGPDLVKGESAILIDDVVTTGESLLRAAKILKKMNINVKKVISIVDRQEGAEENLKREGLELVSIFKAEDFLKDESTD